MFGRLPWFAFERRKRALRFLVFFDIGAESTGASVGRNRVDREPSAGLIDGRSE